MIYIQTYERKVGTNKILSGCLHHYNSIKNFGNYLNYHFFNYLNENVEMEEYEAGNSNWINFSFNEITILDLSLEGAFVKGKNINYFDIDMIKEDDPFLKTWKEGLEIVKFLRKTFLNFNNTPGKFDIIIKISDLQNIIDYIEENKEELEIKITSLKYNL